MDKNNIIIGIGAGLILSGIASLDTFLTNRKLRKAAKSVFITTNTITDALHKCVVDVNRDGRRVSALSMVTPGIVSRSYSK